MFTFSDQELEIRLEEAMGDSPSQRKSPKSSKVRGKSLLLNSNVSRPSSPKSRSSNVKPETQQAFLIPNPETVDQRPRKKAFKVGHWEL